MAAFNKVSNAPALEKKAAVRKLKAVLAEKANTDRTGKRLCVDGSFVTAQQAMLSRIMVPRTTPTLPLWDRPRSMSSPATMLI
jgi:hypothetical protein